MATSLSPFSCLGEEELLLHIAEFLPARDLLQYQSVSKELSKLNTESLWKSHCERRWQPWPRYRLTKERMEELDKNLLPNMAWKQRYRVVERDATRTRLERNDLQNLNWYLSFVLSGIRGEGRSDHMAVQFARNGFLFVPGHPPLPYQIMDEQPPSSSHIRQNLRGDRPFSTEQYLQISDFPAHFITRKSTDAEWLIVNENVMMVSCKK